MLTEKERKVFEKVVKILNADVTKLGRVIDNYLKEEGITKTTKPFFMEAIEQLEDEKRSWTLPQDVINKMLQYTPKGWFTDAFIIQQVPENDWHKYRDTTWIKKTKDLLGKDVKAALDQVEVELHGEHYGDEPQASCRFLVSVVADLSEFAANLGQGEDIDLEIERAFSDEAIIEVLDAPLWSYIRRKYPTATGITITVDNKPQKLQDLTLETKFSLELEIAFEIPEINEADLRLQFVEAFKGVV